MSCRNQHEGNVPYAKYVKNKKCGKNSILVGEIINAVSHLIGDRISELDADGHCRSTNSLWSQLAIYLGSRLPIKNTIDIRKYIYGIWHRKSSNLRSHLIEDANNDDTTTNLQNLSSVPSYTKIYTRSRTARLHFYLINCFINSFTFCFTRLVRLILFVFGSCQIISLLLVLSFPEL